MIEKKEVQHIAKLARLGLSEQEIEKLQKELSKILDYIEKMKEIDVSKQEPTSHPFNAKNVMRKDEVRDFSKSDPKKLLDLAPETKGKYLKVKAVLK